MAEEAAINALEVAMQEIPESEPIYKAMFQDWIDQIGVEDLEEFTIDHFKQEAKETYKDKVKFNQGNIPEEQIAIPFTDNQYRMMYDAFQKFVREFHGGQGQVGGRTKKLKKDTLFWPPKYYKGLSKTKKAKRAKEIKRFTRYHWKDPRAYKGFKTNVGVRTKASSYTELWNRLFPNAKSLEEKSKVTGVPLGPIRESYNRGMAAWRTGHRPGATQQQWGYARVHSFLLCGKTHFLTDADLVRKAKASSAAARKWWSVCPK